MSNSDFSIILRILELLISGNIESINKKCSCVPHIRAYYSGKSLALLEIQEIIKILKNVKNTEQLSSIMKNIENMQSEFDIPKLITHDQLQ